MSDRVCPDQPRCSITPFRSSEETQPHPESVGPYRIVEILGKGGMGVVYAAEDDRLGRRVALKTLGAGCDAEARDRLWREARAAAGISHPGICQVYDVEEQDGELWVAMELLEGEGLDVRMKRDRLGIEEAVEIAREVLAPLHVLHERGLVHRDLKPSNIFLTEHGTKILDFGLVLPVEGPADTRLTQTGAIMGTPHYMAPEQWRTEDVGPRSDLFSCGAELYEMLAGDFAFPGDGAIAVFHACAFEQPPPLTGAPGIEAIDAVVRRAIAKDPEERHASARDMSAALGEALERAKAMQTTGPGGTPPAERRAETVRRFIALPFRMVRLDPDLEFLATSLPEAIGGSLSGLQHLVVRSSRLAPKGEGGDNGEPDLKRLAADIEVDYALTGTLMTDGTRLRLTAELLQVPAGTVVWSLKEDVDVGDLFHLQDELVGKVIEGVSIPLSGSEEERIHRDRSVSPRAYELYLRALHSLAIPWAPADLLAIRDLLAASIEEDPVFAPARAQYARVCRIVAKYRLGAREEHLRLAADAFAQAFAQDPDSPLLHYLYTYYQIEDLADARGAMLRLLDRVRELSTAAELWAGLVPACRFGGLYSASIEAHRRARVLDPKIDTSVEFTYLQLAEYDLAIKAVPSQRGSLFAAVAVALDGEEERGLSMMQDASGRGMWDATAVIDALEGRPDDAETKLRAAYENGMPDPEGLFVLARVAGRADAVDLGLDLIEAAVDRGFYCVGGLKSDPWVTRLSGEPRYQAALERARAGRRETVAAFREAGGEELLGVVESGEPLP